MFQSTYNCLVFSSCQFLLNGKHSSNNLKSMVVHTVKQTWSKPNIKGLPPPPRDSHTCVALGTNLYVFGGTDGSSPLRDLHVLDTGCHLPD